MTKMALVSGFARSFISGEPIVEGLVTALENDTLQLITDENGYFGPFEWPVGNPITLVFEKPGSFWSGYKTTQTATIIVPESGINDPDFLKNISFQVPSNMAYALFAEAMGGTEDPLACQITTTITPPNTTMDDIPQGIEGVTVTLLPDVNAQVFYFDIFPIIHKTNPFMRQLEATSLDGGVAIVNVPPGDYTIVASKEGVTFSTINVTARRGVLVNVSPPHGPTADKCIVSKPTQETNYFSFFNFNSETEDASEEELNTLKIY